MSNRFVLFNLNAIKYILPHIDHEELNIKRFGLKALAQLCQLPLGPEQVLEDPVNMRTIAYLLSKVRFYIHLFLSRYSLMWCHAIFYYTILQLFLATEVNNGTFLADVSRLSLSFYSIISV